MIYKEKNRKDIYLGPVSSHLKKTALDERWLESYEDNWKMGFGKDEVGILRAVSTFNIFLKKEKVDPAFGMLGVYKSGKPIGFCALTYLGAGAKAVDLFLYLKKEARVFAVAQTTLFEVLKYLFKKKIYRVQVELLSINKDAIDFFRHFGFVQEGVRKSAIWMGINSFNVVLLRLLRPEWKRLL